MTHEIRGVDVEKYALLCQQTSPKRWFGNVEMTSNCDVTNSANQIQMATIWPLTNPPPMKIFCVRHWLPHKLCRFTPNLCNLHALLFQHLYSEFFQHTVWNGPTSKTVWMQRRQKNWKKYTDVTEVKKITSRIYSNCSNYSSLFFKSFKFRCCSFFFIEKCTLNCTSVLLILLLTS